MLQNILILSQIDLTQVSDVLKQFESKNEKEERESKNSVAVKKNASDDYF